METVSRPLIVSTTNALKRAIIEKTLTPHKFFPFTLEFQSLGADTEVQGSKRNISRVKIINARNAIPAKRLQEQIPILVEDTSLAIPSLGGMPGPYLKHFRDTIFTAAARCNGDAAAITSTFTLSSGMYETNETFTGVVHGTLRGPSTPQDSIPRFGRVSPARIKQARPGQNQTTTAHNSILGDCFIPDNWPKDANYDDISTRLEYGCHYSISSRKLFLLLTLRRAVAQHCAETRYIFQQRKSKFYSLLFLSLSSLPLSQRLSNRRKSPSHCARKVPSL